MIKGVLLDIDGTLLRSNSAHAHAFVEALHESGFDVPFDAIRPLIGMGGGKVLGTVVPGLSDGVNPGKEIAARAQAIFLQRYAPDLQPQPGSRALVERLRGAGFTLTVATSAKSDELGVLLHKAQIADLVEEKTTSSDAAQSKPEPDIVEAAVRKSGVPAGETIMIGDTPYDIESAGRAGVATIALLCGGHTRDDLASAIAIYQDPADLLAHFDESPLATK